MPERLRRLLQPLNLVAAFTLLTVALSLRMEAGVSMPLVWALIAVFMLALLATDFLAPQQRWQRAGLYLLEAVVALAVLALSPRIGTAPVLLVILISQLAMDYPPRVVLPVAVLLNVALYLVLSAAGHGQPLLMVAIYIAFQAFAALLAHYAKTVERSRDALARVNADLLATRALLADSARDAERLRVARELHDVAGHKLTAMTLNLRVLAADPAFAGRNEVVLAQQLASELLGDIRNVVQALRDARGLDLATALHALAAPLPRPRLQLDIGTDLHVTHPGTAETILRVVQEALTNSARHGDAENVRVALQRQGDSLQLTIEDDGRLRGPLREGNGLAGMRERIDAAGGALRLSTNGRGALRIAAELPF